MAASPCRRRRTRAGNSPRSFGTVPGMPVTVESSPRRVRGELTAEKRGKLSHRPGNSPPSTGSEGTCPGDRGRPGGGRRTPPPHHDHAGQAVRARPRPASPRPAAAAWNSDPGTAWRQAGGRSGLLAAAEDQRHPYLPSCRQAGISQLPDSLEHRKSHPTASDVLEDSRHLVLAGPGSAARTASGRAPYAILVLRGSPSGRPSVTYQRVVRPGEYPDQVLPESVAMRTDRCRPVGRTAAATWTTPGWVST